MLIAFHKPYGLLSQFTPDGSPNRALAEFGFPERVYPIGRLDADSEGLLLLSDEPEWNQRLLEPQRAHQREYWAQVERVPTDEALEKLATGVRIQGRQTRPGRAWLLDPQPVVAPTPPAPGQFTNPGASAEHADGVILPAWIPPRVPPIRYRKRVPDCWIGLELTEGKNRQVRRMTAAVGHPTLRLLRVRIGRLPLGTLTSGRWKMLSPAERALALS